MIKGMKQGRFAAASDGSNDTNYELYPIMVTCFDPAKCLIQIAFFAVPNLIENSTGENISQLIMEEFKKCGISSEPLVSLMADVTLMLGGKYHYLFEGKNLIMGYLCNLIQLLPEKDAVSLHLKI
ncbi:hypothetical protein TNCV_2266481 [Trichonephila clavipes]|nr:hypothetical protein TNCV_2266481 [Trichonephila clavipes]